MLIFGISEFSARFPATIIGSFLILLSFILGKNIRFKTGFIFAFLCQFHILKYFESTSKILYFITSGYLICLILFLNYTKKLNLKSIGFVIIYFINYSFKFIRGSINFHLYNLYNLFIKNKKI